MLCHYQDNTKITLPKKQVVMQDKAMRPITIYLEPAEKLALASLARRERRDYRDQAALLIRVKLIELGVLQDEPTQEVRHDKPGSV